MFYEKVAYVQFIFVIPYNASKNIIKSSHSIYWGAFTTLSRGCKVAWKGSHFFWGLPQISFIIFQVSYFEVLQRGMKNLGSKFFTILGVGINVLIKWLSRKKYRKDESLMKALLIMVKSLFSKFLVKKRLISKFCDYY